MISLYSIVLLQILALQITASVHIPDNDLKLAKEINDELLNLNEAFHDREKIGTVKKYEVDWKKNITPLSPLDVKCIISNVRYCSKNMDEIKRVMIQAVQEDCIHCTESSKDEASRVITALMAHHQSAWKSFVTKYNVRRS